jgi:hypothetical protein
MSDFPNKYEGPITWSDASRHAAELGRRKVMLRATTALFAITAAARLDKTAFAQTRPPDDRVKAFVNLSAALTGIPATALMPNVDPIDLKREYLRHILDPNTNVQAIYERLEKLIPAGVDDPGPIRKLVGDAANTDEDLKYLSRSIILLWYLGAWYSPAALKAHVDSGGAKRPDFRILSSNAYTHGWVWRVAQAHPMGYSDMQFGYWKEDPALVERFVGGTFL